MASGQGAPGGQALDRNGNRGKTKKTYSEFQLRVISAAFLAGFALFCTWMGGTTFVLLAIASALLIFYEFRGLVRNNMPARTGWFALCFLVLVFAAYLVDRPTQGIAVAALAVIVLGLWEWVIRRSVWGALALLYTAAPFAGLVAIRNGEAGLFEIFFIMGCVWGADTFAYFAGRTFGGPKLAPAISPNKTWSGFFGGIAGSVAISLLIAIAFGYAVGLGMVFLAVVLSLFSQIGDLFESWIKRRFGAKDSGRLIPGHGGILDRIDGLIFAIVAAWLIGIALSGDFSGSADVSRVLEAHFFDKSN